MKNPTITLAICTRNRQNLLRNLLDQVAALQPLPDELIVVENITENQFVSLPFLRRFFEKYSVKVKYFTTRGKNVAVSRNIVLKKVTSDILLSVDDDVFLFKKTIDEFLSLHKKHQEISGFVGGLLPVKKDIFSRFTSSLYNRELIWKKKLTKVDYFGFSILSLRTLDIKKETLFFDENLNTGEDVDFTLRMTRAGYSLFFSPSLMFKSDFSRGSMFSFFKRFYSYARSMPALYKKTPAYFDDAIDYVPKKRWYWFIFPLYFFMKPLHQSLFLQKKMGMNAKLLFPNYVFHCICMSTLFFSKEGFSFFWEKFRKDFF